MSHWYTKDAQLLVDATLRDARKKGYRPGVTDVLKTRANPGLDIWKEDQIILSAWQFDPEAFDSFEDYRNAVRRQAQERRSAAPSEGSKIHGHIARMMRAYEHGASVSEWQGILEGEVDKLIMMSVLDWYRDSDITATAIEESFSSPLGWAGTVDLYGHRNGHPVILDWKTTGTLNADGDPKRVQFYRAYCEQLVAYAHGMDVPHADLVNVSISRDEPGRIEVREWGHEEKDHAWRTWRLCFALWCEDRKYDPAGESK